MTDKEIVIEILQGIHPDEKDEFEDKAFNLSDLLVKKYNGQELAEVIYHSSLETKEVKKISRLLDMLIWSTPDNGTALSKITDEWFKGNEKRKIEILLYREDIAPVHPNDILMKELDRIKKQFPDLTERCIYWEQHL